MYITKANVLFHANIFGFQTVEKIPFENIKSIDKANTGMSGSVFARFPRQMSKDGVRFTDCHVPRVVRCLVFAI